MRTSLRSWGVPALLALLLSGSLASQWWGGHQERQVGVDVAALAQPGDIRMLSSETCAICATARAWFTEHRVPYSECLIERDAQCKADFDASRAPGTPLLVVRGLPMVGFSPHRVRQALQPPG